MEIVYKGYIYESRHLLNDYEIMRKYGGNHDYYFSYRDMHKVGINPKSIYSTPNGVYTYNYMDLDDRFYNGNDIPFKGDLDGGYIYVLKLKPGFKGIDSDTYGKDDLDRDLALLKEKYPDAESPANGIDYEKIIKSSRNSFKAIWDITRLLSYLPNHRSNPNKWTMILLGLGYSYVRDRGVGVIHPNEPQQTVFLDPKSYDVIDYGVFGKLADISGRDNFKLTRKEFSTEADPSEIRKFNELLYNANNTNTEKLIAVLMENPEYFNELISDYTEYVLKKELNIAKTLGDDEKEINNYLRMSKREIDEDMSKLKTYPNEDDFSDRILLNKITRFLATTTDGSTDWSNKGYHVKYDKMFKELYAKKLEKYRELVKTNLVYLKAVIYDKGKYFNLVFPEIEYGDRKAIISFINKYYGSSVLVDLIAENKFDVSRMRLPKYIETAVVNKINEIEDAKYNDNIEDEEY